MDSEHLFTELRDKFSNERDRCLNELRTAGPDRTDFLRGQAEAYDHAVVAAEIARQEHNRRALYV